jgi:hypothetical protein
MVSLSIIYMYNTSRLTLKGNEHDDGYVHDLLSLRGKSKLLIGVAKKTFQSILRFILT